MEVPSIQNEFGQRLAHLVGVVGGRGGRQLRIAILGEGRADREVHAGAPGRQQDVDLVLVDQAFDRLDQFLVARLVVIGDHFDGHPLVAELDAAGGFDVMEPKLVVGHGRDAGARGVGAGHRDGVADLDLVLGQRAAGDEQTGGDAGCNRSCVYPLSAHAAGRERLASVYSFCAVVDYSGFYKINKRISKDFSM